MYKRQVYQYSLRQMEQKKGYEYDTLIDLDITSPLRPVSYTHLDVYKRQGGRKRLLQRRIHRRLVRRAADDIGAEQPPLCLLYTSRCV